MSDTTDRHVEKPALNLTLQGIAGSPGIALGTAYLVERADVGGVAKRCVEQKNIPSEVRRFKEAVKKAQKQLQDVIEEVPVEFRDHIYILDAHMMLLKDRKIYNGTIDYIKQEKVNAECWHRTFQYFRYRQTRYYHIARPVSCRNNPDAIGESKGLFDRSGQPNIAYRDHRQIP
jgi:signal transduction protein with GAF and PtsI domain